MSVEEMRYKNEYKEYLKDKAKDKSKLNKASPIKQANKNLKIVDAKNNYENVLRSLNMQERTIFMRLRDFYNLLDIVNTHLT